MLRACRCCDSVLSAMPYSWQTSPDLTAGYEMGTWIEIKREGSYIASMGGVLPRLPLSPLVCVLTNVGHVIYLRWNLRSSYHSEINSFNLWPYAKSIPWLNVSNNTFAFQECKNEFLRYVRWMWLDHIKGSHATVSRASYKQNKNI